MQRFQYLCIYIVLMILFKMSAYEKTVIIPG